MPLVLSVEECAKWGDESGWTAKNFVQVKCRCDTEKEAEELGWIQCDNCYYWQHGYCAGVPEATIKNNEEAVSKIQYRCLDCDPQSSRHKPTLEEISSKMKEIDRIIEIEEAETTKAKRREEKRRRKTHNFSVHHSPNPKKRRATETVRTRTYSSDESDAIPKKRPRGRPPTEKKNTMVKNESRKTVFVKRPSTTPDEASLPAKETAKPIQQAKPSIDAKTEAVRKEVINRTFINAPGMKRKVKTEDQVVPSNSSELDKSGEDNDVPMETQSDEKENAKITVSQDKTSLDDHQKEDSKEVMDTTVQKTENIYKNISEDRHKILFEQSSGKTYSTIDMACRISGLAVNDGHRAASISQRIRENNNLLSQKEGSNNNCLEVSNLSPISTEETIGNFFGAYGVEKIELVNQHSNERDRTALVYFHDNNSAMKALIQNTNREPAGRLDGSHIRVKMYNKKKDLKLPHYL